MTPDATRAAFDDGWFRTGDIGEIDDEGYLYIRDRMKDMIISGGENIYPAEIENVITGIPRVSEVAAIVLVLQCVSPCMPARFRGSTGHHD